MHRFFWVPCSSPQLGGNSSVSLQSYVFIYQVTGWWGEGFWLSFCERKMLELMKVFTIVETEFALFISSHFMTGNWDRFWKNFPDKKWQKGTFHPVLYTFRESMWSFNFLQSCKVTIYQDHFYLYISTIFSFNFLVKFSRHFS